jgi:GNAT superfamily N-acetyltransferase
MMNNYKGKIHMKIRPASIETDLPDIVRITNPYENVPLTVDQVRSFFEYNPPGRIQYRLVTVDERGTVTGYAGLVHDASAAAHGFIVWVIVDPASRRRGIGAVMWEHLLAALQEHGATHLKAEAFDNDPVSLGFAERRGFTIHHHEFASYLDLATFDETPYLPAIADLTAQGLRFCPLADFPDTPEIRHKHFDLNTTLVLDIPNEGDGPHWNYAEFEKFLYGAPWFRREGQLLAIDGELWVGMAAVSLDPQARSAYNLVTGVLPPYRGRKIAQVLKIMATRYARQHGTLKIGTDNDSTNAPMLAINRKMGYQPQPGKYGLVCQLMESHSR